MVELKDDGAVVAILVGYPIRGAFYVVKKAISGGIINAECFLKCNDDRMLEEILTRANADLESAQERLVVIGQVTRVLPDLQPDYVRVYLRESSTVEFETYLVSPKTPDVVLDDPKEFVPLQPKNVDAVKTLVGVVAPEPQYDSSGYIDL